MEVTCAVLVGGGSRRMGTDKAALFFGREKLVERVVARLKRAFPRMILVGGKVEKYSYLGLPVVQDVYPGRGPLAGIHAALAYAATPYVFVTACDMPFADPVLALFLARQAPGCDVVVVRDGSYLEPLFAVYGKGCLPAVEHTLKVNMRPRVVDFFPLVKVKYIERHRLAKLTDVEKAFFNVNTPQDLERALREEQC